MILTFRRYILFIFLTFSLFSFFVAPIHAKPTSTFNTGVHNSQLDALTGKKGANLAEPKDAPEIAARIIKSLLGLMGMVAIIAIVYAGFLILTAAGEEEKITKAKTILKNSVIGAVLILSAYSITIIVVRVLTGDKAYKGDGCWIEPITKQQLDPLEYKGPYDLQFIEGCKQGP